MMIINSLEIKVATGIFKSRDIILWRKMNVLEIMDVPNVYLKVLMEYLLYLM